MTTKTEVVNKNMDGADMKNSRDKREQPLIANDSTSRKGISRRNQSSLASSPASARVKVPRGATAALKYKRTGPDGTAPTKVTRTDSLNEVHAKDKVGAMANSGRAAKPPLRIDKLTLAVLLDDVSEAERMVVNMQLKTWLKAGRLKRGSVKGKGFKNAYVRSWSDGFTLEVRVNPSRAQHAKQFMNFTINPEYVTDKHVTGLESMFAKLFPGRSRDIIRHLRLYRIDVRADFPVDVNSLVIRQRRARVESKFFVSTDAAGMLETIYLGSISSDVHGVAYDQNASDDYKRRLDSGAHLPPLEWVRSGPADDAAVVIKRTRFEVRRVFADLPHLEVLEKWTAPFDRWDVWQIRDVPQTRKDAAFWMYLDVVRWRGVAGAKLYLLANGSTEVGRFEKMLDKFKTEWWQPATMALDMKTAFRSSKLWTLLNPDCLSRGGSA